MKFERVKNDMYSCLEPFRKRKIGQIVKYLQVKFGFPSTPRNRPNLPPQYEVPSDTPDTVTLSLLIT